MSTYIAIFRIVTAPIMLPCMVLLFTIGDMLANLHGSFVRGRRHKT